MKNKKKAILIALLAVLIVSASGLGTYAFLTSRPAAVTNTFVVGKLLDDPEDFVLREHIAADDDRDGVYTLLEGTENETDANSYLALPGVPLPKDPFVRIDEALKLDAYVFVEVGILTEDVFTLTVDTDVWTPLSGTGPNGGTVYTLKSGMLTAGSTLDTTYILKDNLVTVAAVDLSECMYDDQLVVFYGYLIQAKGFADAAAAFDGIY